MYKRPDGLYERKVTINGKRVRFRSKTVKSVNEQILNYQKANKKGPLLSKVIEEYIDDKCQQLSPTTLKDYGRIFEMFIMFTDDCHIGEISPTMIQKYVNVNSHLTRKTLNNRLIALNQLMKYAYSKEYTNCVFEIQKINLSGKRSTHRSMIDESIIPIIRAHACDDLISAFIFVLLFTGMRKGERLALKWSDVDFESGIIHIRKSVYYEGNQPRIKTTKTENSDRDIYLLDAVKTILSQYRANTDSYVFSDTGKSPWLDSQVRKRTDAYCNRNGVKFSLHELRHTYASILHSADIDVKTAQILMGHADIRTTQNIYTHLTQQKKASQFEKLNTYVSQQLSQ